MTVESNSGTMASKVAVRHLERWALVYIRQSTAQQVLRNQESTRLQYALRDRALALGWSTDRIEIIDDDLGLSGAEAEGRPGFQRLVAEVGLDHVGVILGLEMSRFARSCRDWHQLLEICALFGTLIADLDGVYDPANHNDRLLLGLKGTISEAELYLLKRRMQDGRMAKAQRGELGKSLPIGYLRRPSGEVIKDPDEQVQTVVACVFEQFERIGSAYGVLRYLREQGVQIPVRVAGGPRMGDLDWKRPVSTTLRRMLNNPMYAGAYVYGWKQLDKRLREPGRPGTGFRLMPPEKWKVFLPERFPAYISMEQYRKNLEQLRLNQCQRLGTARQGRSLVAGLLYCGHCGRRMATLYPGNRVVYVCGIAHRTWYDPYCQSLSGSSLDTEIERRVLEALEPAALELSMAVAADVEARRAKEEQLWSQRLERCRYEAERAHRQYDASEPENRLVVRTLERVWEEKLQQLRSLEEDYHRHRLQSPPCLSAAERAAIQALAEDIPGLWHAPQTTCKHRKEIIRQLIDRIVVTVLGASERVKVVVTWAGGFETCTEIVRPVRRFEQLSYHVDLLEAIRALRKQGLTAEAIAERLNAKRWRTPKGQTEFKADTVREIAYRKGLVPKRRRNRTTPLALAADEWTMEKLAETVEMPIATLYLWARRGWLRARRAEEKQRRWIVWADAAELERIRSLREATSRERSAAHGRQADGTNRNMTSGAAWSGD